MIRIENGRLIQLYTAVGTTFFGNYLPAKINSFPIAMDYRTAGRKGLNFVKEFFCITHVESRDIYFIFYEMGNF